LTKKRSIISWYKRLKGSWIVEIKVLSRDFQLFETFKWKQPNPPDPLRKAKILLGDFESGAKISPVVNW